MNGYFNPRMKDYCLNLLRYKSFPGYSFDCWLMSSCVTLDKIQDKEMLDDSVEAKRGSISVIMGDRFVDSIESKQTLWYIDDNDQYV